MAALSPDAYAFTPFAVAPAASAVLMLGFGAHVLRRRLSRASVSFFALTAFAAIWLTAFTMMSLSTGWDVAWFWARIAYLGVPFLAPAIYQFALEMLRIAPARRFFAAAGWVFGCVYVVLATTTSQFVMGVRHFRWGYYPAYDPVGSVPFVLYFGTFLVAALVEFVRAHPRARGVERVRIRLLIIAFAVSYVGAVDFLAKYGLDVYPFGFLAIFGFVAIVAHTVRRYDLIPITPSLAANEIIRTMADLVFVCDRDGRIQFANPAAEQLLGFRSEELTGSLIDEIILTRGDNLNETLRRRSVRSAEYEFVTRKGENVDLTLSISPVMHQGEAAGAVIIGRDMRERKRSEREVRRALSLLQTTLDSTADGIVVVGDGGQVLNFNQRFVDMWRIPSELMDTGDNAAMISVMVEQLLNPRDFVRTIESVRAQPAAESFELLEFKDGRRFERYSIGRQIGDFAHVRVWSFRDVTARYRAETALRESEARYRLLFEQNAAGVCVTRFDGEIVDCNSPFAMMVGHPRPELLGRNIGDLHARRVERDELAALLADAGSLTGVEVELRRSDGRHVWVLENLALIGGPEGVIHSTLVDISDRKRAEEQIEFHAYHDVLTQLPNRRLFIDRLGLGVNHARRSGRPLAVLFIDLDHFKTVNDTLGHNAGDELLLEMSGRLRSCIRDEDTVARMGGDEFTLILSELTHAEDAAQVAQKILDSVQRPVMIGTSPVELSASIGIALYPTDGLDVETLLRNADSAMYRAKDTGRNNYQLCTEELKTRAVERLSVQTRLRRAVSGDQLELMYQPQVSLATGRIVGVEALVRWNDPERGLVEPLSFIPLAEESRLIVPIGEWVLARACAQADEWREQGVRPMRIGVNLSARQFQQSDLVDVVSRAIGRSRIDPSMLELEITETTAMQMPELSVEIIRALCDIGVTISIDDFGTGYSSLNYLKQFPISAVKIDRAFTAGVATDDGDAAIVTAVIAIARSLRLRVVAEGVETAEQFEFLRRRECDEAQGFYFSPPLSASAITRILLEPQGRAVREPRLSV